MLVSTYMRDSDGDSAKSVSSVWRDIDIRKYMERKPLALSGVAHAKLPALNLNAIWWGILACRAPLSLKHVVGGMKFRVRCRGTEANQQRSK